MAKKDKAPTFEEVDNHVSQLQRQQKSPMTEPPDANQICTAYKAIRPLLMYATTFVFLPGSWKDVIKNYMATCDEFCP